MITGGKIHISSNHHKPLEDEQDESLNKVLDFTVLSGEDEEDEDGNKVVESEFCVILIMRFDISFSIIPQESAYVTNGVQFLRQSRTSVHDHSGIRSKSHVVLGKSVSFMTKKTAQQ